MSSVGNESDPQLRSAVLDELHEGHPGIRRMKCFARNYVWWLGLDADLERRVRNCVECQREQKLPAKTPIQPWEWPETPWSRLHIDHAGPVLGKQLLVIMDAHSKWIETHIVSSTSAAVTIDKLRQTFATHGGWLAKVSDYGTANFQSQLQTENPGSPVYTAPESRDPTLQSPKMDIYSFSVLLVEMYTCEWPAPERRAELMEDIDHQGLLGLIRQCLREDRDHRPMAAQLVGLLQAMQ